MRTAVTRRPTRSLAPVARSPKARRRAGFERRISSLFPRFRESIQRGRTRAHMALSSRKYRPEIRQTLTAVVASDQPNRQQSIDAFNTLRDLLRKRLEPMFGAGAVDALFARSLVLAAAEFPWW